jgi:hypothetical protein
LILLVGVIGFEPTTPAPKAVQKWSFTDRNLFTLQARLVEQPFKNIGEIGTFIGTPGDGCHLGLIELFERRCQQNSTPRNRRVDLSEVSAFLQCGYLFMLQKNPESESVRNEQQRHYQSRKEVCGSQLPRQ